MEITRRAALAGAAALTAAPAAPIRTQAKPSIKLGMLADLSGPYNETTGAGTVACARQAATEFNPGSYGFDVQLIQADHQNKADVGASIARQWFDQGVDAIVGVPTSSVALAVAQIAKQRTRSCLTPRPSRLI